MKYYSKEILCEIPGRNFVAPSVIFWASWWADTTKWVLCCRELALRKLPPGRVGCSCLLSLCCCCSLVCGRGHGTNPEFVRSHFAHVCSRWTMIMTRKINVNLLSFLSLELIEFFGPLCEISYRLRDLFCETILVTKINISTFRRLNQKLTNLCCPTWSEFATSKR